MTRKNVLVIEPDTNVAESLQQFLGNTYALTFAQTAVDAIALTSKKKFNAIVLELALKGEHGGLEFLHEFKSYADTATVPIIVFTLQQVPPSSLVKVGVSNYLYKPKTSLLQLSTTLAGLIR